MAMEVFGAQIGVFAGLACVVSYLFSGHTGIYKAQRVGHPKHWHLPEGLRLGDVPAFRRSQRAADREAAGAAQSPPSQEP